MDEKKSLNIHFTFQTASKIIENPWDKSNGEIWLSNEISFFGWLKGQLRENTKLSRSPLEHFSDFFLKRVTVWLLKEGNSSFHPQPSHRKHPTIHFNLIAFLIFASCFSAFSALIFVTLEEDEVLQLRPLCCAKCLHVIQQIAF